MAERKNSDLSPSRTTGIKTVFETFKILKEEGGQLPGREVIEKIGQRLKLSDWEKEIYEKTGYVRWQSILHFFTIGSIKAGYLRKAKGIWYLTPEGEEAMKKGPEGLVNSASELYRKWSSGKKIADKTESNAEEDIEDNSNQVQKANLDQLEGRAIDGIKQFIIQKTPTIFRI